MHYHHQDNDTASGLSVCAYVNASINRWTENECILERFDQNPDQACVRTSVSRSIDGQNMSAYVSALINIRTKHVCVRQLDSLLVWLEGV